MSQPPFDPELVVPAQPSALSAIPEAAASHPLLFCLQQQQQQLLQTCQNELQQKRLQRLADHIASVTAPEQRIVFIQQQLAQQMALLQQKLTEVTQLLAANQLQSAGAVRQAGWIGLLYRLSG